MTGDMLFLVPAEALRAYFYVFGGAAVSYCTTPSVVEAATADFGPRSYSMYVVGSPLVC